MQCWGEWVKRGREGVLGGQGYKVPGTEAVIESAGVWNRGLGHTHTHTNTNTHTHTYTHLGVNSAGVRGTWQEGAAGVRGTRQEGAPGVRGTRQEGAAGVRGTRLVLICKSLLKVRAFCSLQWLGCAVNVRDGDEFRRDVKNHTNYHGETEKEKRKAERERERERERECVSVRE